MRALLAAAFAMTLFGCSSTVDTSGLDPVGDYTTWRRVDTTGAIPAHLDTYRITYANQIATTYAGAGRYGKSKNYLDRIISNSPPNASYIDPNVAWARRLGTRPAAVPAHHRRRPFRHDRSGRTDSRHIRRP